MVFSDSLLNTPIPTNFHKIGENHIVEWITKIKGLTQNEAFLNQLSNNTFIQNKIYTNLSSNDTFFDTQLPLQPALFIFHMSRCGSTYAANFLATDPKNKVFNEPLLLSNIFGKKVHHQQELEHNVQLAIQLLGMGNKTKQKRLIIKLSSKHIKYFNVLDKLYPNVPKIYIKRNPKEVVVSTINNPPEHLIPKSGHFDDINKVSLHYISSLLQEASKVKFNAIIDYKGLKNGLYKIDKSLFNSTVNEERNELLNLIDKNYSKSNDKVFTPDSLEKQEKWNSYDENIKKAIQKLDGFYNMLK